MPGETKTIGITFDKKYLKGSNPVFYMEGRNKNTEKI